MRVVGAWLRRRAGAPAQRLVVLFLACALCVSAHAQPLTGGEEHLAADRPEAWAMNYLAATTFFTGFGATPALAPLAWRIATDFGQIPRLSDAQRRIGFDGTKLEDLNKSPVFGRLRFAAGLPAGWVGEVGYTPPIEINGTRAYGLVAVALGHRLFERTNWTVSGRLLGQHGSVRGDITCPERLANVADPVVNPYGCQAPSRDRFGLGYYGGELTAGWNTGGWQWHGSAGLIRSEFDVKVDALTNGFEDRSHLFARGLLRYFALGTRHALDSNWSLAAEVLFVPLHVRRSPAGGRESDPLVSLRVQLGYRL